MTSKPRLADVEAALDVLHRNVAGGPDYIDFVHHRNRYRSDALRIGEYFHGGTILEIGAYPYHMTMLLKRLGYPCVGVDLAPGRHAERIAREGLDIRRCDIELEPLPFDSDSLDLVVFNEVFEHLRIDPLFVLSEINRVLKTGATLLLTTPNLYAAQRIARFLLGRGINDPLAEFAKIRQIGHMGHVREYSAAEVTRFLHYAGFAVRSRSFEHYYYPGNWRGRATRLLFAVLPRRLRSFQVVVATKAAPGPALASLGEI